MRAADIINKIIESHDDYLEKVRGSLPPSDKNLAPHDKIDRLLLHVIEELVEMRRTYPRKFWKQSKEELNKEELVEEAADVYLMVRSMYLEVCRTANISYKDFLEAVLVKAEKNQRRFKSGY